MGRREDDVVAGPLIGERSITRRRDRKCRGAANRGGLRGGLSRDRGRADGRGPFDFCAERGGDRSGKFGEERVSGVGFNLAGRGNVVLPRGAADAGDVGNLNRDDARGGGDATDGGAAAHGDDNGDFPRVAGDRDATGDGGARVSARAGDDQDFVTGSGDGATLAFEISPDALVVVGRLGNHVGHEKRSLVIRFGDRAIARRAHVATVIT